MKVKLTLGSKSISRKWIEIFAVLHVSPMPLVYEICIVLNPILKVSTNFICFGKDIQQFQKHSQFKFWTMYHISLASQSIAGEKSFPPIFNHILAKIFILSLLHLVNFQHNLNQHLYLTHTFLHALAV